MTRHKMNHDYDKTLATLFFAHLLLILLNYTATVLFLCVVYTQAERIKPLVQSLFGIPMAA